MANGTIQKEPDGLRVTVATLGIILSIVLHVVGVACVIYLALYRLAATEQWQDKTEERLDAGIWKEFAIRDLQTRVGKLERKHEEAER